MHTHFLFSWVDLAVVHCFPEARLVLIKENVKVTCTNKKFYLMSAFADLIELEW